MKKVLLLAVGIALAGLTAVQWRFLKAGVQLEKARLDRRVEAALVRVDEALMAPGPLRDWLRSAVLPPAPPTLQENMQQLIADALRAEGVEVDFSFTLESVFFGWPVLRSEEAHPPESGYHYSRLLHGREANRGPSGLVLHLRVEHLLSYLLGQLAGLVVFSAIFIALLIGCFVALLISLRRLRRLDAVKNDFINNLTHELKTPVFSISLLLRLLSDSLEKGKREKSETYLGLIAGENDKLKKHIEKVLELASLRSSRRRLEKQNAALHPVLREVAAEMQAAVAGRGGVLRTHLEADCDRARVDVDHFRNAVLNLLDNALKYSTGTPDIRLSTRNRGRRFVVAVADRGIGIERAEQTRIFKKFYRAPTGDQHPAKGFGLGLSYVRQVMRGMGGEVSVESEPGKGSTFYLSLPTIRAAAPAKAG